MKNLTPETVPNYKVRAMVRGAMRNYGITANSTKLALRRAKYRLKKIDRNAVVQTVTRVS